MNKMPKNTKKCVTCRYWNGAMGSATLSIVANGMCYEYDGNEKHKCFHPQQHIDTKATFVCPHYEPRY